MYDLSKSANEVEKNYHAWINRFLPPLNFDPESRHQNDEDAFYLFVKSINKTNRIETYNEKWLKEQLNKDYPNNDFMRRYIGIFNVIQAYEKVKLAKDA